MPEYRFSYLKGQSKPSHGITAVDDDDAFDKMLEFVERNGYSYINGSMTTCNNGLNFRSVRDPVNRQLYAFNEGMR